MSLPAVTAAATAAAATAALVRTQSRSRMGRGNHPPIDPPTQNSSTILGCERQNVSSSGRANDRQQNPGCRHILSPRINLFVRPPVPRRTTRRINISADFVIVHFAVTNYRPTGQASTLYRRCSLEPAEGRKCFQGFSSISIFYDKSPRSY